MAGRAIAANIAAITRATDRTKSMRLIVRNLLLA